MALRPRPGKADLVESSLSSELPAIADSVFLLGRAQDGDQEALSTLFQRYQEPLRRIVRVRLGSRLKARMESMDIVQDAFCAATPRIGCFEHRGSGSLLNWLARIAERQIQDQIARIETVKREFDREVRMESVLGTIGGPSDWLAASGLGPADDVQAAEFRELVDQALMKLPEHYREVILLRAHCRGDWSYIAAELGRKNAHAAEELYRRAGIRLRRLLRPYLREM